MKKSRIFALMLILFCMTASACAQDYTDDDMGHILHHNYSAIPAPMTEYDQWGNITRIYDLQTVVLNAGALNKYTEYLYDEAGNLIKKINGQMDGSSHGNGYEYDEKGNVIKEIFYNSDGTTTECLYEYDEKGNRVRQTRQLSDGSIIEYIYKYDEQGNLVRAEGSDGTLTEYQNEYDGQGRLLSVVDSNGIICEYLEDNSYTETHPNGDIREYDSNGILRRHSTSSGFIYTYNERGYILSASVPSNNQEAKWEYSDSGVLIRQSFRIADHLTAYEYDEAGYLLTTSDNWPSPGLDSVYEFDRSGNCIRITNKLDEEFSSCYEFRSDGTVSRYAQRDWYSVHNQKGHIQKMITDEDRYALYRYDQNDQCLGRSVFEADGSFCYNEIYSSLNVVLGPDYAATLSYDRDENITHAFIYEYDEEGNLLSYRRSTPEEYDSFIESKSSGK